MDTSAAWTFLSGLRISPDQAGFLALVLVFLIFIWRLVKFGIDKLVASQKSVADGADARLREMTETVERIADKFQRQLNKLDERAYDSQMRFQDQLKTLTESHVLVSRDHISALAGIQAAFNSVAMRLEHVEKVVGELSSFPKGGLSRPKGGGLTRGEGGGELPKPPNG